LTVLRPRDLGDLSRKQRINISTNIKRSVFLDYIKYRIIFGQKPSSTFMLPIYSAHFTQIINKLFK